MYWKCFCQFGDHYAEWMGMLSELSSPGVKDAQALAVAGAVGGLRSSVCQPFMHKHQRIIVA